MVPLLQKLLQTRSSCNHLFTELKLLQHKDSQAAIAIPYKDVVHNTPVGNYGTRFTSNRGDLDAPASVPW
jgi:hypothetical protein